ncbi:hypothetical protein [Corynebacterium sp. A21]|uniref:hypothetical protein n=1 Tax=Corynebacterium sp. A21 TaxID=3457318 RepID=UPI003FD12405
MPPHQFRSPIRVLTAATAAALAASLISVPATAAPQTTGEASLLSDPFLQLPGKEQVNVVWFTAEPGTKHVVLTGEIENLSSEQARAALDEGLAGVTAHTAESTQLSRMYEDAASVIPDAPAEGIVSREVHRHEATVTGIAAEGRTPYRVASLIDGAVALSEVYSAQDEFSAEDDLTFLLTSDHQQKNNAPANLQWAAETLGDIDVSLVAGDLINVPDRASEWFDHEGGLAFFAGMQGNAGFVSPMDGKTYNGGQIMQNAVTYPVIGNHEVMGRIDGRDSLDTAFNNPVPREVAEAEYEKVATEVNPTGDAGIKAQWIEDNSFSTTSYEEIFSLPESASGGERYYSTTIGNTRLISLYSTRIWRGTEADPAPEDREKTSRYQEATDVLDSPLEKGHGDFIFEDLTVDSEQYNWLQGQLADPATTGAEHVIVMLHEGPQGLGNNIMPHFADPVEIEETDDQGNLTGIRYEYPASGNQLLTSLSPLIDNESTPVDLVFNGHSHLWNRFKSDNGVNYIETSNVGNSYGARHELSADGPRPTPPSPWVSDNYLAIGNPGGLAPIVPSEAPFEAAQDPSQPAPYVASNDLSVFTGFDSGTGVVSSWVFDATDPAAEPVLLDEFSLHDSTPADQDPVIPGSSTGGLLALLAGLGAVGGAIAAVLGFIPGFDIRQLMP